MHITPSVAIVLSSYIGEEIINNSALRQIKHWPQCHNCRVLLSQFSVQQQKNKEKKKNKIHNKCVSVYL